VSTSYDLDRASLRVQAYARDLRRAVREDRYGDAERLVGLVREHAYALETDLWRHRHLFGGDSA